MSLKIFHCGQMNLEFLVYLVIQFICSSCLNLMIVEHVSCGLVLLPYFFSIYLGCLLHIGTFQVARLPSASRKGISWLNQWRKWNILTTNLVLTTSNDHSGGVLAYTMRTMHFLSLGGVFLTFQLFFVLYLNIFVTFLRIFSFYFLFMFM